jgi:hypothetical protein
MQRFAQLFNMLTLPSSPGYFLEDIAGAIARTAWLEAGVVPLLELVVGVGNQACALVYDVFGGFVEMGQGCWVIALLKGCYNLSRKRY